MAREVYRAAHKCNISAGIASGTTDHVVNLNPVCGESLNKLHDWLTKILRNGLRTKVYNNVLTEQEREQWSRLVVAVPTRWGARHNETRSANMNQCPLDIAIQRMVCPGGVDAALYKTHFKADTLDKVLISSQEWILFQQYEGGFQTLRDYSIFCQHAEVIVHEELFESQCAM